MAKYEFKLLSSLEKVFPRTEPTALLKDKIISGLKKEVVSFQLGYTMSEATGGAPSDKIKVEVKSDIKEQVKIRSVKLVPSLLPAYERCDDNYITTAPGLFPDLLEELPEDKKITVIATQWRALWIDVDIADDTKVGIHQIEVIVKDEKDDVLWTDSVSIKVIDAKLPEQKLIHTEWFHTDCLADYYNVDVFSDEHWTIIDNYIKTATKHGMNMILTPVFTPPLDTKVGGERTTVQLVDVYKEDNGYTFNFDKLKKWAQICLKNGVKYLEIAHLFTQWGAKFTPKIMAWENGVYKRIFGWDVSATSTEYKEFIDAFIPALLKALKEEGFDKSNTYFHISDEPTEEHLEPYGKAKAVVASHLEGYKIIDALSSYEFYKTGLVEHPIPANNDIQAFIDNDVEDLWVYYCCVQGVDVANRFMSMPSARNRILGVQLYLHDIKGFLHWGYNFYNSQYSIQKINPYLVTDAGEAFPSGDAFLVYPGTDGNPVESIRLMVLSQAMYDLRGFELLESLTSREFVVGLIMEGVEEPITFEKYPQSAEYLENLREKVNSEISKLI